VTHTYQLQVTLPHSKVNSDREIGLIGWSRGQAQKAPQPRAAPQAHAADGPLAGSGQMAVGLRRQEYRAGLRALVRRRPRVRDRRAADARRRDRCRVRTAGPALDRGPRRSSRAVARHEARREDEPARDRLARLLARAVDPSDQDDAPFEGSPFW